MIYIVSVVVGFSVAIAIHELGHAYAMRMCGVFVSRISLLGLPGLGTIHLPFRLRSMPHTELVVHPLILGAYAQPARPEVLDSLSRADRLYIFGMGPFVNFLLATVLYAASKSVAMFAENVSWSTAIFYLVIASAVTAWVVIHTWILRRIITQYVLPVACLCSLAYVTYRISLYGFKLQGLSDLAAGLPQRRLNSLGSEASVLREIALSLKTVAVVSFLLGFLNLLPFFPLDGGRIIKEFVHKRLQDAYMYATIPVVALLFVAPLGKDVYNLGAFLWKLLG